MNAENKTYAQMRDGEIVPVYEYHYTGTVNVWTENGLQDGREQQALQEFEQVPSYVERFKLEAE